MSEDFLHIIPPDILRFLIVVMFSLLIGLEQRRHHINEEFESLFGTDRTFTLIGILGFILYVINPQTLIPFLGGGAAIAALLSIFYFQKISIQKRFGLTSLVTALVTYCIAPLIYTQPHWLVLLIIVTILVLTEIKETLFEFSKKFDNDEFITLAKFLVLAGVVLPLLPDEPVSATLNFSTYKFGLSIVAVSGISYFSYLLKKFVFPESGIVLTGILGGMYSSTATTFILARKSKEIPESNKVTSAIILATTMMYLRLFLLALFFNMSIAMLLLPYFAIFIIVSVLLAVYFLKFTKAIPLPEASEVTVSTHSNPLELKTATVFGVLFIFFAFVTGYVNSHYGTAGVNVLSLIVGVTDIDPFILNLFQNKQMLNSIVVMAVLNAITSNNLLKMIYGVTLSSHSIRRQLIVGFGVLIIIGLLMSFVFH